MKRSEKNFVLKNLLFFRVWKYNADTVNTLINELGAIPNICFKIGEGGRFGNLMGGGGGLTVQNKTNI